MISRSMSKQILAGVFVLATYSGSVWSNDDPGAQQWRAASDLIIARPLGAAITLAGAAAFVVGLPFSWATGSVRKSADTLVIGPARETFVRCLGCVNAGRLGAGETSR